MHFHEDDQGLPKAEVPKAELPTSFLRSLALRKEMLVFLAAGWVSPPLLVPRVGDTAWRSRAHGASTAAPRLIRDSRSRVAGCRALSFFSL